MKRFKTPGWTSSEHNLTNATYLQPAHAATFVYTPKYLKMPKYSAMDAMRPLPAGERSDRAWAIRVRGISFTSGSPLTRNGREAPIPTSPLRGEVDLLARFQRNAL